ncbi:sigma-E processing peptidase SpoIIGA [Sporosarcina jiandibaonis]|uniref:sigma-E processing peptidase SpoIIGA n=1 Tax=Sporosarcina jiandibaonis TaxID=2715535 RepID=UPI00155434AE|nr:sigma-E processing peptidase SpoIIGA [Sporosarcina jiandibaonis]
MYGELIIGLNMLFNFVILSFANKVVSAGATRGRLIIASLLGAIPVTFFPSSVIAILISFICMTICAFGIGQEQWKNSAVMVLIGAVVAGGLLTVLQNQITTPSGSISILLYAVIAYISLYLMKKKWLDVRTVRRVSELIADSTLYIWNEKIQISVFVDSGNSCTEPLSGAPVHFVSFRLLEDVIPEELKKSLLSWDPQGPSTLTQFPEEFLRNIRLIKLMTVQGHSWAVGIKFEKWTIEGGNELEQGYIVLTKEDRRYPNGTGAILHVSAMETIIEERGTVHAA